MALTPDEEARLAAAEQKANFAESTLNLLLANGLDDMLTGSGRLRFGGGMGRLSANGLELHSASGALTGETPRKVSWTSKDFDTIHATVYGAHDSGLNFNYLNVEAHKAADSIATMGIWDDVTDYWDTHQSLTQSDGGFLWTWAIGKGLTTLLEFSKDWDVWPDDSYALYIRRDGTLKKVGSNMKTSGGGYYLIPTGPSSGTTVTSSASANTYGSWTEMRTASGNALYIVGISILPPELSTNTQYTWIEIGVGNSGSESSVGEWMGHMVRNDSGNDHYGIGTRTFPYPIPVAANTRIACRVADGIASAQSTLVILHVIDQADLVSM